MKRKSKGENQGESADPTQEDSMDQPSSSVTSADEANVSDDAVSMPTGGTAPLTENVTSEPLVGLASMPDVQEHAIQAAADDAAQQSQAVAKVASNKTDPQGRVFDPALHEVDPITGEPRLSTTGKLRCKRGRGAKGATPGGFKVPTGPAKPDNSAQTLAERNAKIESTATVVCEMIFMGGRLIGGDEWEPVLDKARGVDERGVMKSAWSEYFRVRGIMDVPPEIMLCAAVGSYAIPRCFLPKTKSRLQSAKEWFYGWMGRRRARKGMDRETQAYDTAAFAHPAQP